MCLAIAQKLELNNSILSRLWRIVSSTPLRLFSFCAFIHSLVLGGLFMHNTTAGVHINLHVYMLGFTYGILALLAFGYLLTWLPNKFSLSPIHYGRYNIIYLLMMIGLGTLEAGILFSNIWIMAGVLLLIPAWLLALQCLRDMHIWINSDAQQISRVVMLLLAFNFINLSMSILGQLYSSVELTALATSSSIFLIWPLLVVTALVLLLNAPSKGRVISP